MYYFGRIMFLYDHHDCLSLSLEHLVVAVPVAVVAAVGGFLVSHYLSGRSCKKGMVNTSISKDSPKVVHSFDMEEIGTKAVYCRCWKSKKVRQLLQRHSWLHFSVARKSASYGTKIPLALYG